jgi:hypothetical protein
MNIELNAGWPKTKAAIEDYEKALGEFRGEIIDGEPTIDAFFMAIRMQMALRKITKALGDEYLAKQPSFFSRARKCLRDWLRR